MLSEAPNVPHLLARSFVLKCINVLCVILLKKLNQWPVVMLCMLVDVAAAVVAYRQLALAAVRAGEDRHQTTATLCLY